MPANPQYVVLFHHFRAYLAAAARAGVDVAPLKGAHLLANVHPPGTDRGPISDVDFLVREEQWGAALAVAERLGWRRLSRPGERADGHEAGFALDLPDGREALFEAHRALFDPSRYAIDHAALWSRASAGTFEGEPCRVLAPEDHFAHIAFHEALHRFSSLGRTLRDLDALLSRGGVDGGRLAARAREWRVTRTVWLMLGMVPGGRERPGAAACRRALEPPFPARLAVRSIAALAASGALDEVPYRVKAPLAWPLFDSRRDLARFVLSHPSWAGASRRLRSRSGTSRSDRGRPPA